MQPDLRTARLLLRPFTCQDAAEVERLAGDARVALPTAAIPHPYPPGTAAAWIASHPGQFQNLQRVTYAITDQTSRALLGCISLLEISAEQQRCEIGYWIGHDYWSQGIGTEAAIAIMAFAQERLNITRFEARCLASNRGSARLLEKAGMVQEGRLIKRTLHRGNYADLLLFGKVLAERDALQDYISTKDT